MDKDEAARIARATGLTRMLEANPEQLRAALDGAADSARRLPQDLHWTEEPAHVYSLAAAKREAR